MALVSLQQISLAFGGRPLLDEVTLQVEPGERVCLLGRNGEGKSTLLRVINDEVELDGGEIVRRKGLRCARLEQEVPPGLRGTVHEVAAGGPGPVDQLHLEKVLSRLELPIEQQFAELSGGLKRRVLLARALAGDPELLLLDEPTNHLDIAAITKLEEILLSFSGALVLGSIFIFAYPALDVSYAIYRRICRRSPLFKADQGHIHHVLLSLGFSVRKTALIIYAINIFFALMAIILLRMEIAASALLVIGILTAFFVVVLFRYLLVISNRNGVGVK